MVPAVSKGNDLGIPPGRIDDSRQKRSAQDMNSLILKLPKPLAGHIAVLDELKGLAILLVVLYHSGGVVAWNNTIHGELGVDLFVVLSGIGLAYSRSNLGWKAFVTKRILRLFPAYWFALTLFLFGGVYILNRTYTKFDIILHYLGIQTFFGDVYAVSINDAFWFITLILLLYFLFLILRPLLVRPDRLLFVGFALSLALTYTYFYYGQPVCYAHFSIRIPLFFLGLLCGRLLRDGELAIPLTAWLGCAVLIITYVPYIKGIVFANLLIAPAIMLFYVFGWKHFAASSLDRLTARPLKFLGDYSYELYLLHQPLMRYYNLYVQSRWLKISPPPEKHVIIGMIITFILILPLCVGLRQLQLLIFPSSRPVT